MGIDLLSLKPHKVSRDLSGYITYIYGAPKTGKTTLAAQMPNSLLLAFEKGYNALPGIIAQDITTWGQMKEVYRELKKPEVRERFKAVVVDTADIAASCCEKYICNQNDIDKLGDIPYGGGWTLFKKEFEDMFRGITQLGYAVFFISHEKEVQETDERGNATGRILIRPSLSSSPRAVIENLADIYGYAKSFNTDNGSQVKLLLRSTDGRIACGCRFKYIEPVIDFTYEALSKALNDAIDKEASLSEGKFVTDERENVNIAPSYDYNALMTEFNQIVSKLMDNDPQKYGPHITQIIERYLGKGKKISETTLDQAELVYLVISDIKEELLK